MRDSLPTKDTTEKQFRLKSPFHSNDNYSPRDLQTITETTFTQPITQNVINDRYKQSQQNISDALKHISHLPPKYKSSGLSLPTNPNNSCKVYQVLSPKSKIPNRDFNYNEPLEIEALPTPKPKPWIGSNRASSKNQLTLPHSSYDLDNDGVVSSKEYAIAKFFDKDRDGKLNKS
eukprot:1012995_1